ncbi:Crp/Fnr family transcriptional regulator [Sediminitomix flava]|uniref:CRP-like cAMP-binding protein n=1 Tax=Sediminitomix flava TaxID=379075 RepID=A0A315ZJ08_SEDFL|nr:Crp/Fnr family transcriptional regulator [Sediminitomix flava]PWJ44818.1 CRP-like cAMP-binding protein [Sediminitomix flava]
MREKVLENFKAHLLEYSPSIEEIWDEIASLVEVNVYPAHEILLAQDEVCRHLYYVYEGLIRVYLYAKDKDITLSLMRENIFTSEYDSFDSEQPNELIFETLEKTTVVSMTKEVYLHLLDKHQGFGSVMGRFYKQRMREQFHFKNTFLTLTPYERYEYLMEKTPELFQRVPQQYLASYIGMTPVSFSRIKKRYAENNRSQS